MEENTTNQASRKRLLLSWYIDFLFFMTLWGLLAYFMKFEDKAPFWLPYVAFVVIRATTARFIGSIGYSFLGIDKNSLAVSQYIKERESWLTILLGVFFILEGTKQLVRWTQLFVPQPAFGFFPSEPVQIALHVLLGVVGILAGYWFLKLDYKGLLAGMALSLASLVSAVLSWQLWDPVIEQMLIKRREYEGRAIREGEIEMMQAMMPEGIVVIALVTLVAMAFALPNFRNHKPEI